MGRVVVRRARGQEPGDDLRLRARPLGPLGGLEPELLGARRDGVVEVQLVPADLGDLVQEELVVARVRPRRSSRASPRRRRPGRPPGSAGTSPPGRGRTGRSPGRSRAGPAPGCTSRRRTAGRSLLLAGLTTGRSIPSGGDHDPRGDAVGGDRRGRASRVGVASGPGDGRGVTDGAAVGGRVTIVGASDGSGPASTGAVYDSSPAVRKATPSAVSSGGERGAHGSGGRCRPRPKASSGPREPPRPARTGTLAPMGPRTTVAAGLASGIAVALAALLAAVAFIPDPALVADGSATPSGDRGRPRPSRRRLARGRASAQPTVVASIGDGALPRRRAGAAPQRAAGRRRPDRPRQPRPSAGLDQLHADDVPAVRRRVPADERLRGALRGHGPRGDRDRHPRGGGHGRGLCAEPQRRLPDRARRGRRRRRGVGRRRAAGPLLGGPRRDHPGRRARRDRAGRDGGEPVDDPAGGGRHARSRAGATARRAP